MATEVIESGLGEFEAASTAGGGTALTTTAKSYGLLLGAKWVSMTPRNFSTAAVVKCKLVPWLTILKSTDNMATLGNLSDVSNAAQDASTSTTISLNSLATGTGEVWIGSHVPFRGVYIDVQNTNSTGSTVLTVKYWNDAGLVSLAATDGTSSSVSLDQDGTVTWTVPSTGAGNAWKAASLNTILKTTGKNTTGFDGQPYYDDKLYWTQWTWDKSLDSSVSLNSIVALSRRAAYGELLSGQTYSEKTHVGYLGAGGYEALTDAGTANIIVNCASLNGLLI